MTKPEPEVVEPPMQWSCFVRDNPAYAAPSPGWPGIVNIEAVNHHINAAIQPRGGFTPPSEPWLINPARGRCGDYAVTKYVELVRSGWSTATLSLAECITPMGAEHCVLLVHLPSGWSVLDNRTSQVCRASLSGLKFLRMQSPDDPGKWFKCEV